MAGNDSNITAFFGGDTSGLEAALGRAESKVGEIGKKLEDRFVGTRDVAHALATALGLNIEHMAESVARFVTGLSEDQEKQMKALLEQSDRVTDKMIKAMRSTLTDEQAYQMALKERESLQAKIAARTEEMGRALELERKYATDILTAAKYRSAYNDAFIDRQKAMNDLAEKETEIAAATGKEKAAQLEAQKKETAELIARNKVADEAATAAMSVSQKISFLQDGIKAGETVVVSAASGAVGSVAGQIAKLHGCRVVGIAGGASKGAHVVNDLGFDACVDYRGADFGAALKTACPAGIDVYFDNVGGEVRDAVWPLLNQNGRVVVCGMISEYNESPRPGPAWFPILTKRLTLRGFLMSDFANRRGDFVADMSAWYRDGRVKIREDIVEGLENTPSAFIGMLRGTNFGKTIVKL